MYSYMGKCAEEYEDVLGGYRYGVRNTEGETILELGDVLASQYATLCLSRERRIDNI